VPVAPIITEVDGEFAGLAGVYGGWLINQKFLIGGAAYFQTNVLVVMFRLKIKQLKEPIVIRSVYDAVTD